MKFLVFQHIDVEHPGIFRDYMREDGIKWDIVELDAGETIPKNLKDYDALLVMGGPMDVWEEDKHPWLIEEKAAIREFVKKLDKPYLGFCLGHQLLATALGGKVDLMPTPEVGVMDVEITEDGKKSVIFDNVGSPLSCLQWHGAGVTEAPENSSVLAQSPDCAIQALQVGNKAFSIQFHIEVTDKTVSEWAAVAEYAESLEKVLGKDAIATFDKLTQDNLTEFNQSAKKLYDNFLRALKA